MVLPLVPLVIIIASGATGGSGVVAGAIGGVQIRRAQTQMRSDARRYRKRHAIHLTEVDHTNAALQSMGRTQERAQNEVILRMLGFLERHAKQVRAKEHLILDGVDGARTQVVGMANLDPDVAGWVRGVVGSTIAGIATQAGVRTAVVQFASASTGTAISTLGGAAARGATLAFLGGGSLAAGGGGMALGASMLNVAVAGPTLLVAGLTVKNRGTKASTEAAKLQAEVAVDVAQLDARDQILRGVRKRAAELDGILVRLLSRATDALDLLESEPFDIDLHAERLQAALILVKSVRDVAAAPIADDDGNLNETTEQLVFKYRDAHKEAQDA